MPTQVIETPASPAPEPEPEPIVEETPASGVGCQCDSKNISIFLRTDLP